MSATDPDIGILIPGGKTWSWCASVKETEHKVKRGGGYHILLRKLPYILIKKYYYNIFFYEWISV